MGTLLLIAVALILYLIFGRKRTHTPSSDVPSSTEDQLSQRNYEWAQFIASYRAQARTKSEKALVEKMLADIAAKGLPIPAAPVDPTVVTPGQTESVPRPGSPEVWAYDEPAPSVPVQSAVPLQSAPAQAKVELDNISLLLYFGAFLFVASMGLFVAFSGAAGGIRTLIVLAVALSMYFTGIWLYRNKPKLQQAGLAFSGIGMTVAPLVGVAAYNFLSTQQNGPTIWLITSVLCLVMYAHALIVFRKPFISYILIFTFLSLFESGVSIVNAPIYYFGWMLAIIGLGLAIASRAKGFWPEMQESSQTSAQLLLPLTLIVSLVMVPQQGVGQLAVSLLLATVFYVLEALNTSGETRQVNAVVAQATGVIGIACLAYFASPSWQTVAITLLVVNALQLGALISVLKTSDVAENIASTLLAFCVAAIVAGLAYPGLLVAASAFLVVSGLLIWRQQQRVEAYALAVIAWMAIPFAVGQYLLSNHLSWDMQALVLLAALFMQIVPYAIWRHKASSSWIMAVQMFYILSAVVVLATALFGTPWVLFGITIAVALSTYMLADFDHDGEWVVVGGFLIATPLIRGWDNSALLVATTFTGLAANIVFSLQYRKELNRWFSTLFWMLVPVTLGATHVGGTWQPAWYAWSYILVAIGLIISRAIARGAFMVSAKISLASYARSASLSYVAGYSVALFVAGIASLQSTPVRWHASLVFAAIGFLVYILARRVEKQTELYVLLPLILQVITWVLLWPKDTSPDSFTLNVAVGVSSAVAAVCYVLADGFGSGNASKALRAESRMWKYGALLAAAIAPLSILATNSLVLTMPLSLIILGLLLSHYVRNDQQSYKEISAAVTVAGFMWILWYFGVDNIQAYTHITAIMFGIFAYWRALINDTKNSDNYLLAMLATATIPLGLQALSGTSGGVYGWWLLLEQIAFMLLGMTIGSKLVIRWGLYVALGAILYQLRSLGWAALTVLALFIIGIAIYQLQKHEKN